MKEIKQGTTDESVYLQFLDTAGLPFATPTSLSAGIALWYRRTGGAKVAISLSDLGSVGAAHSDGGMIEIDDGVVRLDLPDAAFAAGATSLVVGGAITDGVVVSQEISLPTVGQSDVLAAANEAATRSDVLDVVRGDADPTTSSFITQKPFIFSEHEWGTTDPTCMLTTGDAVAQVGDVVLKWMNAAKTITAVAVGTPTLVHRVGQRYPSINLNGASGFVIDWVDGLDANPLDVDYPAGAFAAVFRRLGGLDATQNTIAGLSSTNSTGTRIAWITRQIDETRIQCLTGMQIGGNALRTWDGISGGRLNCQMSTVWASDDVDYITRNPLKSLSGASIGGAQDGIWLYKYGSFDRHVTTFGFLRNTTDNQFLIGDLQYIAWYTNEAVPEQIYRENNYHYPVQELNLFGDSRVNSDLIFQANSDFENGLNLAEHGDGSALMSAVATQIDTAIASGSVLNQIAIFMGVNDILSDTTGRALLGQLETALDYIFSILPESMVLLFNEIPSNVPTAMTTARNLEHQLFSLGVSDVVRRYPRTIHVDTMTPLRDSGTDGMATADSADGIHPTVAGYVKMMPNIRAARQASRYKAQAATLADVNRLQETVSVVEESVALAGPYTVTVGVTTGVAPIENAIVRMYKAGASESKSTDANGEATFTVEAATWTVAITHNTYTGVSNSLVVTDDAAPIYAMVAKTITAAAAPLSTVVVTCTDENGDAEQGVILYMKMKAIPAGGTGYVYDSTIQSATSDADGLATLTGVRLATYQVRRGDSRRWRDITLADAGTTDPPSWIGAA
jgi:hypothetical protein